MKASKQSKPTAESSNGAKHVPFLQRKPSNTTERPFISAQNSPQIQPKLSVNEPGDKYEQEADRMAERVMRMPMDDGNPPMISGVMGGVQRKCAACEAGGSTCSSCAAKEEKLGIQRKSDTNHPIQVSDTLASRLNQRKVGGLPLSPALNEQMSTAFQKDFSGVRLHTDAEAVSMSDELNAQAFTYGQDIYFNAGKFQPETREGRGLLGHELTHTVQQGGAIRRQPIDTALTSQVDVDELPIAQVDFTDSTYGYLQYRRKEIGEALKPLNDPIKGISSEEKVELENELALIENEMLKRVHALEIELNECSTNKLDAFSYYELVERKNILADLMFGKLSHSFISNDYQGFRSVLTYSEISQNYFATSSEITSRNKAAKLPLTFTTCQDFSSWSFIELFYDYQDAVDYLRLYSEPAEKATHQEIVHRLRTLMDEKIQIEVSPEQLIKDFSKNQDYVNNLSSDDLIKHIYAIESYLGDSKGLTNGLLSKYFKQYGLINQLNIVLQNLQLLQGLKAEKGIPYHLIIGDELMEDPNSAEALAIDPVGIRYQILSMYRQDYENEPVPDWLIYSDDLLNRDQKNINQFIGSSIDFLDRVFSNSPSNINSNKAPEKVAEPFPLFDTRPSFATTAQSVEVRIYKLKQDILVGKHPTGIDPKKLISMIDQQYSIIKYERETFLRNFEEKAKDVTLKILEKSENKIKQERIKYGLKVTGYHFTMKGNIPVKSPDYEASNTADLLGMSYASKTLAQKGREIENLKDKRNEVEILLTMGKPEIFARDIAMELIKGVAPNHYHDYQVGSRIRKNEIYLFMKNNLDQINFKQKEYDQLRKTFEADYPILASWAARNDYSTLETLGFPSSNDWFSTAEMVQIISADMDAKQANINEVRDELGDDISIWEMYEIMDITQQVMNVPSGSIYSVWINDKRDKVREDKEFWDTFLDVLSMGLGILAAPFTGGASLALVGASLAIQGYRIIDKLDRYQLEMAMYGTDFDPVNALIHQEPSLDWLVWDLVGLGFDAVDLVKGLKVFEKLKGPAKQFVNAPSEQTKKLFLKAVKEVGEETGKELLPKLTASVDEVGAAITAKLAANELRDKVISGMDELLEVSLEGGHRLKVTKTGQLVICSNCIYLRSYYVKELAVYDDLLEQLEEIEDAVALGSGKLTKEEFDVIIRDRARALDNELRFAKLAKEMGKDRQDLKKRILAENITTSEFLELYRQAEILDIVGRLNGEIDHEMIDAMDWSDTFAEASEMQKVKTAIRRESSKLKALKSATYNLAQLVPGGKNTLDEFQDWFDALTLSEFRELWSNPLAKDKISDLTREPGGFHEWLKVSQLPKIKEWGLSMRDVHELRTLTTETVGKSFLHGRTGSSSMHQKLDEMFDESSNFLEYRKKLNDWADLEMPGHGRMHLPQGLQLSQADWPSK